ncbi:hypothetical protein EON63_11635 [archaeon]|nr:MAG: hypothetical protein EON63_11635 [archaeon]
MSYSFSCPYPYPYHTHSNKYLYPNPNPYLYTIQALVEDLLRNYSTTMTLRVRMPISDDLSPRNFVTKIVKYEKVRERPCSMLYGW